MGRDKTSPYYPTPHLTFHWEFRGSERRRIEKALVKFVDTVWVGGGYRRE